MALIPSRLARQYVPWRGSASSFSVRWAVSAASATSGRSCSSAYIAATRWAMSRRIGFSECTGQPGAISFAFSTSTWQAASGFPAATHGATAF